MINTLQRIIKKCKRMNHRWGQSCFSSSIDSQLLFIIANVNKSYCLSHKYQLASYDSSHSNSYKNITCQLAYLEIQGQASCIKYTNVHAVSLDHTLSIFLHSNLSKSVKFLNETICGETFRFFSFYTQFSYFIQCC